MKLSTLLMTTGILGSLATIYFWLKGQEIIPQIPFVLCDISLIYFGILEQKNEKQNKNEKSKCRN